MVSLGRGASRYAVRGVDEAFVDALERFYRGLRGLGGRYVFECRGGRCVSLVEGVGVSSLLAASPGVAVERCGLRGCGGEGSALLPPPPAPLPPRPRRRPPGGDFALGYTGGLDPVCLRVGDLWGHVGVFGATGSGKTHTAARLARCVGEAAAARVVVLDWHNEYHRLLPRAALYSHPRLPPAVLLGEEGLGVDAAVGVLEAVLGLTPNQSVLLTALLAAAAGDAEPLEGLLGSSHVARMVAARLSGARDMAGLLRAALEAYRERALEAAPKGELEVWTALIRRLAALGAHRGYRGLILLRGDPGLPRGADAPVVLNLASIQSLPVRRLYALAVAQTVFAEAQAGRGEPTILVMEEAHNMLVSGGAVEQILSEARKYSVALVLVTHTPRILPPRAIANLNTVIAHRVASPEDLRAASQVVPGAAETLPRLPRGAAVVYTTGWQEPIVTIVDKDSPCSCSAAA